MSDELKGERKSGYTTKKRKMMKKQMYDRKYLKKMWSHKDEKCHQFLARKRRDGRRSHEEKGLRLKNDTHDSL